MLGPSRSDGKGKGGTCGCSEPHSRSSGPSSHLLPQGEKEFAYRAALERALIAWAGACPTFERPTRPTRSGD